MELRQLKYFATVARELHFTRAAQTLRVAQPALSRQIQQLEGELGVALFRRNKRAVALTAEGARFLAEAESILAHSERAVLNARTGGARSLNIGYAWGLFHSVAPAALQRLREAHPELSINLFDLSSAEQSRALAAGKLDAGFIGLAHEAEAARLPKSKIGSCRFVIALPEKHALAKQRKIDLARLRAEVFLLIASDHFPGAAQVMIEACAARGFRPRTLHSPERGHTILSLVAANCGVALLPEPLTALPHQGVVFRQPNQAVQSDLFLAWRGALEPEIVEALLAAARPGPGH